MSEFSASPAWQQEGRKEGLVHRVTTLFAQTAAQFQGWCSSTTIPIAVASLMTLCY